MNSKNLFVHNSIKLFEILDEIKEHLNFNINYINQKNLYNTDFDNYKIIL